MDICAGWECVYDGWSKSVFVWLSFSARRWQNWAGPAGQLYRAPWCPLTYSRWGTWADGGMTINPETQSMWRHSGGRHFTCCLPARCFPTNLLHSGNFALCQVKLSPWKWRDQQLNKTLNNRSSIYSRLLIHTFWSKVLLFYSRKIPIFLSLTLKHKPMGEKKTCKPQEYCTEIEAGAEKLISKHPPWFFFYLSNVSHINPGLCWLDFDGTWDNDASQNSLPCFLNYHHHVTD